MSEAIVTLSKVNKIYHKGSIEVPVLTDFDLTIEQNEFVSIMGPSGTGKSTLLNLIGGLDQPSTGTVNVAGFELNGMSNSQLADWRADHIGFVFQSYHLIPVLTAIQNVELPLLLKNYSKKERRMRAEAALALVELSNHANHYPRELSGGQEQRVAIARAIVTNPDILICDEPTGGLDSRTAKEILDLLQILNRDNGKTIVMVTHDPVAASYATRQLALERSELKEGTR